MTKGLNKKGGRDEKVDYRNARFGARNKHYYCIRSAIRGPEEDLGRDGKHTSVVLPDGWSCGWVFHQGVRGGRTFQKSGGLQ